MNLKSVLILSAVFISTLNNTTNASDRQDDQEKKRMKEQRAMLFEIKDRREATETARQLNIMYEQEKNGKIDSTEMWPLTQEELDEIRLSEEARFVDLSGNNQDNLESQKFQDDIDKAIRLSLQETKEQKTSSTSRRHLIDMQDQAYQASLKKDHAKDRIKEINVELATLKDEKKNIEILLNQASSSTSHSQNDFDKIIEEIAKSFERLAIKEHNLITEKDKLEKIIQQN